MRPTAGSLVCCAVAGSHETHIRRIVTHQFYLGDHAPDSLGGPHTLCGKSAEHDVLGEPGDETCITCRDTARSLPDHYPSAT